MQRVYYLLLNALRGGTVDLHNALDFIVIESFHQRFVEGESVLWLTQHPLYDIPALICKSQVQLRL
jgi:hypothetical protein